MRTIPRSYLYVPGDRADLLEKSARSGADAVIADLEDGVRPAGKANARRAVRDWLTGDGAQQWVRVNADTVTEDLSAVVVTGLAGLMIPKAEAETIRAVGELLDGLERERDFSPGAVALIPLIESASALLAAAEIAALPRVHRLAVGEVDLAADLGIVLDGTTTALTPIRLQFVVASAAAGIARPIGPTSTAFRDLDGFRSSAGELYRLGFRARTAIHPAQVPVIHDVFTPDAKTVAEATDLVARFEAAGGGGALDAHGHFIDGASVRHAREVLALAVSGSDEGFVADPERHVGP